MADRAQTEVIEELRAEAKKHAEEAEKQRQLAYTMVMQNPQAQLIISKKFDIKLANESFLALSGYTHEQLQQMNIRDFKVLSKSGHNLREAMETRRGVTGEVTVEFPTGTRTLEQHTIPLLDRKRDIVSIMAVYNDLTGKRRQDEENTELAGYSAACLLTLAGNLEKLAQGNLDFNLEVARATSTTEATREQFLAINNNLTIARDALRRLITDADTLARAAVEGDLGKRADLTRHHGEYRTVVEGFNRTLDAVISPVTGALQVSVEYAQCNFSARMDKDLSVAGDFRLLKEAMDNIGIEVSRAVALINQQLALLAGAAREAESGITDISAGAAQIAKNAGEVNRNADQSRDGIGQVLKAMTDLSAAVQKVASSMDEVSLLAKSADHMSSEGVALAGKADQSMALINDSAREVDANILEINEKMRAIGKIVKLIRDIAAQTNLLALNAAIEAARAGEAGKGFAVVAAEVKALAEESRGSAENIARMIEELQVRSGRSAKAVRTATQHVTQGSRDVAETLAVFNRIADAVSEINRKTGKVAAATEQQSAGVEEVTASVHDLSGFVRGTATEAGDAAAATEEASAAVDEITRVIERMNRIVEHVSTEMAKFSIDTG